MSGFAFNFNDIGKLAEFVEDLAELIGIFNLKLNQDPQRNRGDYAALHC